MATGTRALTLKLLADVDNFTKNLDKADKDVSTFGDKVTNFGKKAGAAFAVAGAAAVAYAGKLAIDGVKAAIEDEAAQKRLSTSLKNVTGATENQIKAVEDQILKTSLLFGVTDEDLRPSLDRLVRSTKNVEDAQKLQTLALDIAAGTGKDLQAVSEALAKAHDGNFTALKKLGGGIDENIIKSKDFDAATAALAKTFENQASKQAETFQGKMDRLTVAFDEGKETVGVFILEAITPIVETIVKKVVPALQDFTSNLSDKLQPVIKIIRPVVDGLRTGFERVRDSLQSNNDELKPFFTLLKSITDFIVKYVAPAIGETLGFAFESLGSIISGIIGIFASFVDKLNKIYNTITGIIDAIRGAGSAVGNFFSGASFSPAAPSGPSFDSSPFIPTPTPFPSGIYQNVGMGTTNITVNGAIDSESTARQIVSLLNDSSARGTLGSSALYIA
jgi:hypothetical protein